MERRWVPTRLYPVGFEIPNAPAGKVFHKDGPWLQAEQHGRVSRLIFTAECRGLTLKRIRLRCDDDPEGEYRWIRQGKDALFSGRGGGCTLEIDPPVLPGPATLSISFRNESEHEGPFRFAALVAELIEVDDPVHLIINDGPAHGIDAAPKVLCGSSMEIAGTSEFERYTHHRRLVTCPSCKQAN